MGKILWNLRVNYRVLLIRFFNGIKCVWECWCWVISYSSGVVKRMNNRVIIIGGMVNI